MKALVKILNWIEWISAGAGIVFMLLGTYSLFFKRVFRDVELVNYFIVASTFFLLAIMIFLFIHLGQFKKE